MKEKSKTQIMRENVWWRKIIRLNPDWKQTLKAIKGTSLRNKVASICWWDLIDKKHNVDLSVITAHMRKYKFTNSYPFKDEELRDVLHKIGYPINMAMTRSKTPKSSLKKFVGKGSNERKTK